MDSGETALVPALAVDPSGTAGEDRPHEIADRFRLFGRAILIASVLDGKEVEARSSSRGGQPKSIPRDVSGQSSQDFRLATPRSVLPDTRLVAIACDGDMVLGILHSRIHEAWALAQASRHGIGNDPTYNSETCFDTFPFPEGLMPTMPAGEQAPDPRAQAIAKASRELVEARDRWLNPPELVQRVPKVAPGFPDRILPIDPTAEAALKKRTLTNLYNTRGTPQGTWLDNLHRALDEAVADAYGWPVDLPVDEVLGRLLTLNQQRQRSIASSPASA